MILEKNLQKLEEQKKEFISEKVRVHQKEKKISEIESKDEKIIEIEREKEKLKAENESLIVKLAT